MPFYRILIGCFLFFSGVLSVYAAETEVQVRRFKNQIYSSNQTVLVAKDLLKVEETANPSQYVASRKSVVRLSYDRSAQSDMYQPGALVFWHYKITYELRDQDNPASVLTTGDLELWFDDQEKVYEAVNEHALNLHNVRLVVTGILAESSTDGSTYTPVSQPFSSALIPNDIFLELKIQTSRFHDMSSEPAPFVYFDGNTGEVSWNFIPGAESYELEYVFIDEFQLADFPSNPNEIDPFLFNPPVRIQTPWHKFRLEMVFPKGKLFFRVRGVGRFISGTNGDYSYLHFGPWGYFAGPLTTTPTQYDLINGFEENKNWLYAIAFADDGKFGSTIAYYDGALRPRQSQAYSSTDDYVVVSEQKFDYEGRATISIAPAPKPGKDLHYSENFNPATDGSTTFPITPDLFDGVTGNLVLASPSSGVYGAGQFFSPNNQFTSDPFRNTIPDGQGMVYTQVEYLRDGTGRISESSGIGETFAMGNGHTTKYYYGTPTEVELYRLFGDNVGDLYNYDKNMVVDANGQVAVIYSDGAGKTIATALAGASPENLVAIDAPEPTAVSSQLIGANVYNALDHSTRSDNVLLTTSPNQSYSFAYDMSGVIYQTSVSAEQVSVVASVSPNPLPIPICLDCIYKVSFRVYDQEGNPIAMNCNLAPYNGTPSELLEFQFSNPNNPNCTSNTFLATPSISFTTLFQDIGAYRVVKELSLVTQDFSATAQALLDNNGASLEDLINYHQEHADLSVCENTCEGHCAARVREDNPGLETSNPTLFASLVASCVDEMCGSIIQTSLTQSASDNCQVLLENLKEGVSYRQSDNFSGFHYAEPTTGDFWTNVASKIASNDIVIYASYVNGLGQGSPITNITTIANPINWQDQWADELVKAHREYCHYSACTNANMMASNQRDFNMMDPNYNGYTSLQASGLINPATDPINSYPGVGTMFTSRIANYIQFYQPNVTTQLCPSGISIPNDQLSTFTDNTYNPCIYNAYTSTYDEARMYLHRSIYQAVKQHVIILVKENAGCYYYGDGNEVMIKPDIITDPVEFAQESINQLFLKSTTDCQNTAEQAAGAWMSTLNDCIGNASQTVIDDLNDKMVQYALSVCGYENPFAYIITGAPATTAYNNLATAITNLPGSCSIADISVTNPFTECENVTLPNPASDCFYNYINYFNTTIADQAGNFSATPTYFSLTGNDLDNCAYADFTAYNNRIGVTQNEARLYPQSGSSYYVIMELRDPSNNIINLNDVALLTDVVMIPSSPVAGGSHAFKKTRVKVVFQNGTYSLAWVFGDYTPTTRAIGPGNYATTSYCIPTATNTSLSVSVDLDDAVQDCYDFVLAEAANHAQLDYQNAIDNFIAQLNASQYNNCFSDNINESFIVSYNLNEYHYTLFYYDQAGNLVQTVPPKGVNPLGASSFTNGNYNHIDQPNHTLKTTYSYNFLNQITRVETPDGGVSSYYYDDKQRLRFSQDAQQAIDGFFSYIKYDELGRTFESGESAINPSGGCGTFNFTDPQNTNDYSFPSFGWNITKTFFDYDVDPSVAAEFSSGQQQNLRGGVNRIEYHAGTRGSCSQNNTMFAQYFSYDEHGAAKEVINYYSPLTDIGQQFKKFEYEYDLKTGKTTKLTYQKGKVDQLIYKYDYDAANRITNVYTSNDGQIWEQDVKYFYNATGATARVEIGHDKVQGMDYTYTIHGNIKCVNSSTNTIDRDPSTDGKNISSNLNRFIAADVFGFSFNYFQNDYTSIGTTSHVAANSGLNNGNFASLYDGNMSSIIMSIRNIAEAPLPVLAYTYQHDQLQRLKQLDAVQQASGKPNDFNGSTALTDYHEEYTYDANGNITDMLRFGNNASTMDILKYNYIAGTNKLAHVDDNPALNGNFNYDADDQNSGNYSYDASGRLIGDTEQELGNNGIQWNSFNKITHVNRASGNKSNLEFAYGPDGSRWMKIIKPRAAGVLTAPDEWTYEYYVLDPHGNPIAIYRQENKESTKDFYLDEHHIYGTKRLGIKQHQLLIDNAAGNAQPDTRMRRVLGLKRYELTNHQGNVLQVIKDAKLPFDSDNNNSNDTYIADIIYFSDYYPFGLQMPGRFATFYATNDQYRYAFQGQEFDKEFTGADAPTHYSYEFRMHDARLGRFLSIDPLSDKYPHNSPYAFSENALIAFIELEGLEKANAQQANSMFGSLAFGINYQSTSSSGGAKLFNIGLDLVNATIPIDEGWAVAKQVHSLSVGVFNMASIVETGKRNLINGTMHLTFGTDLNMEKTMFWNGTIGSGALEYYGYTDPEFYDYASHACWSTFEVATFFIGGPIISAGLKFGANVTAKGFGYMSRGFGRFGIETNFAAKGGGTFYRAMSNAEYAALESSGGLSHMAGKELFVSSSANYSRAYLQKSGYDVLVQFNMKPGAMNYFNQVGVMHRTAAGASGWAGRGSLLWKSEQGVMNLGIQSNTHMFNPWINSFKVIK